MKDKKIISLTFFKQNICEECYFNDARNFLLRKGFSKVEVDQIIHLAKQKFDQVLTPAVCFRCKESKMCFPLVFVSKSVIGKAESSVYLREHDKIKHACFIVFG